MDEPKLLFGSGDKAGVGLDISGCAREIHFVGGPRLQLLLLILSKLLDALIGHVAEVDEHVAQYFLAVCPCFLHILIRSQDISHEAEWRRAVRWATKAATGYMVRFPCLQKRHPAASGAIYDGVCRRHERCSRSDWRQAKQDEERRWTKTGFSTRSRCAPACHATRPSMRQSRFCRNSMIA